MMLKYLRKLAVLFVIGGGLYTIIEVVWRALRGSTPTHWSMFIVGGLAFVLIGGINEFLTYDMPLVFQCAVGAVIVTGLEFVAGCILNLWLKLNVWDYSTMPGNVLGQICPQFMAAWFLLTGVAILLDDYIRYWFFDEEKPHYTFLK